MKELKMMGGGNSTNYKSLTATPDDVVQDKKFIGSGNRHEQTGTLTDRAQMNDAPGISANYPNIPSYEGTSPQWQTNTQGRTMFNVCPPHGKFPGNGGAYVAVSAENIGITAGKIANGQTIGPVTGNYGSDSTAGETDIRSGKVAYTKDGRIIGSAKDYGNISKTLGAGESYTVGTGFYSGGTITAKNLASQTSGTVGACDIVSGKTAYVNGNKVTGSMPDRGTYQYAGGIGSGNDGTEYYALNQAPQGYYHQDGLSWAPELRLARSTVRSFLGVDASKIVRGQAIADVWGSAYKMVYKQFWATSESGTMGSDRRHPLRFNTGMNVELGVAITYNRGSRDICVFTPHAGGYLPWAMTEWCKGDSAYNSVGYNQGEDGYYFNGSNACVPVYYVNASYQIILLGYEQ